MSTYSITLEGREISYTLKTSARRRTIGMRIDHRGLTVSIPAHMPRHDIHTMLRRHAGWILRKLERYAESRQEAPPQEWQDGAVLRFLGREVRLCLRQDIENHPVEFDGARLHVALTHVQDSIAIRHKVVAWLCRQALTDFTRRVELFSVRLGVPPPRLFLSNAKTRWGSCNTKGEIRLHWRLIQAPPHLIDYVVAHELAHLKEMNHGPRFWKWVAQLYPDFDAARRELKALSPQLHLV
jgi:hypothetical protein